MIHTKNFIGILLVILIGLSIFGCAQTKPIVTTGTDLNGNNNGNTDNGNTNNDNTDLTIELTDNGNIDSTDNEMKKFSSTKELLEYLFDNQAQSNNYYGSYGGYSIRSTNMLLSDSMGDMERSKSSAPMAVSSGSDSGQSATDFSSTNIQVEGVDEADIVKNDGKYIYLVNQNNLVIVNAYPANNAEVIYEEEMSGRPKNLFVNDDKLILFVEDDSEVYSIEQYDFMPRPRYVQRTKVVVYDISDRTNPKVITKYYLTGNYFEARMIGDYVYFVVQDNVYYYNNFIDVPAVRTEKGAVIVRPDIYYFDNPENNYVFHTVSSFNVNDESGKINSKAYLMGYSNTMYVSEDNIYIAYQKNLPWRYYETDREDKFFNVVVPMLPAYEQQKIKDIKADSDLEDYEKWMKISEVLEAMYSDMTDNQENDLVDEIYDAVQEYDAKKESERRKSVIHKINIDKGDIKYDTSGEVSGYLLNQFSLDENNKGDLRVATTTYTYTSSKSSMYNNVYVLDDDLDVIGKIENIAPDEKIYSTRFIGDRLYMVTFKNIDPLFVIDLKDSTNPKILGKLKIPGYSDYLHPYDENHIIGIGKETEANEWGGVSTAGVKLALFDVTDVENPKELDKYEIGDQGTDSEALRDHKAFLFDKEKNILVIPVREVKQKQVYDSINRYYQDKVWQGAYVFGLTPKDGFEVKAKISHMSGFERYYYYYTGNAVRRSLYMDDTLYTISGKKILANDMENDFKEINEIKLPFDEGIGWYWY